VLKVAFVAAHSWAPTGTSSAEIGAAGDTDWLSRVDAVPTRVLHLAFPTRLAAPRCSRGSPSDIYCHSSQPRAANRSWPIR